MPSPRTAIPRIFTGAALFGLLALTSLVLAAGAATRLTVLRRSAGRDRR